MSTGSAHSNSAVALSVGFALSIAAPAYAQSSPLPAELGVKATGCGNGLPEVRELPARLAVELAPVKVTSGSAAALLEVETSCSAVLKLVLRRGGSARARPVDLTDVKQELRGVALAVVAAEFVRSAGAESSAASAPEPAAPATARFEEPPSASAAPKARPPSEVSPPAPRREAPPAKSPTPESPPARRPSPAEQAAPAPRDFGPKSAFFGPPFEVGASATARWFSSPSTLLTGGAIDFRTKRWLAHAGAALGSEDDSLGVVRLSLFTAGFGIRHELATAQSLELFALARGELGWAHASAEASALARERDPENALFASASAGGEIVAHVIDPLALGLTVHGGAARGVTVLADDRAVTGTSGFMLGVDLSLRYGNASASADRRPSGRGSASSR